MKTLIVYASKHGCAKKAAEKLSEAFGEGTEVNDIRSIAKNDIADFDRIIIGGSIHAGRIQKDVKKFIQKNLAQLLEKQIGLYICCMEEGESADKEFTNAFPKQLIEHAVAKGFFGGEFNFENMNFIERFIVKKIAKVTESVSNVKENNIIDFINTMKK
ncbi:MAG: flavodoxin domain-containing protein [Candidatus Marinimicrobia bacterium]|nr:flavodoxin domain-containing protein [Candidatus Neomarinimicrobiota bacterium]